MTQILIWALRQAIALWQHNSTPSTIWPSETRTTTPWRGQGSNIHEVWYTDHLDTWGGWCRNYEIKRITGGSKSPRETKVDRKDRRPTSLRVCPSSSLQAITVFDSVCSGFIIFYTFLHQQYRSLQYPLFRSLENADLLTNCASRCCTHDDPKFCVRALIAAWSPIALSNFELCCTVLYQDMRQVRIHCIHSNSHIIHT